MFIILYINFLPNIVTVHRALADIIIALNFASGTDEDEMRQKCEKLDAKYRNQFVREVISQKGTEEVSPLYTPSVSIHTCCAYVPVFSFCFTTCSIYYYHFHY